MKWLKLSESVECGKASEFGVLHQFDVSLKSYIKKLWRSWKG